MKRKVVLIALLLVFPLIARADSQWVLDKCTLTYHVVHPLHHVEGVSTDARGKGVCHAGECNFLIAVPVKSFNSGDSNRDLHMLQITRGALYPMVVVRTEIPQSELKSSAIRANLEVQFAGQTAHYQNVPFQLVRKGKNIRITGTVPATCSDFKISRPELLTIPIKNDIPISVDATWSRS
jgi:hypothetical protein